MDGFLVVDKPAGISSHDVVARIRKIAGQKKVGHTGTLDPFATGVLPVALGEATKAITFLDESVKAYHAVMKLGSATDTQDCTGTVISEGDWRSLSPEQVAQAARCFIGAISQFPPMYSAVKQQGVPLYKLARRGEEVERAARDIIVHELTILRIELPLVEFSVNCSRGTYVRTLAADLGEALGCGAHLTELRRTRSGLFSLDNALTLDQAGELGASGSLSQALMPLSRALAHLPDYPLTDVGARKVSNGVAPKAMEFVESSRTLPAVGERLRLTHEGSLLAVAAVVGAPVADGKVNLRILRGFNPEYPLHENSLVVQKPLPITPPVN